MELTAYFRNTVLHWPKIRSGATQQRSQTSQLWKSMAKRHSSCATRLRPYSFFVVTYVHVITCVPGRVICNQPNTSFLILWLLEHHPRHSEPPASDFALPLVIGGRLTCVIPLLQVSHYGAEITREWIPILRCDVLITSLCTGCTALMRIK